MTKKGIRILIVEDEPLIARNIQQVLSDRNYSVSGIAYDQTTALDKLAQGATDLILLDINLNGKFEGLDLASIFYERKIPFIFITSYADEEMLEKAIKYQPAGYIVKPFEDRDLYAAIEVAWYNYKKPANKGPDFDSINNKLNHPLTRKELEVLEDLYLGKSYKEIAEQHFISINTVNTHVKNIYSKLQINSRAQLQNVLSDWNSPPS